MLSIIPRGRENDENISFSRPLGAELFGVAGRMHRGIPGSARDLRARGFALPDTAPHCDAGSHGHSRAYPAAWPRRSASSVRRRPLGGGDGPGLPLSLGRRAGGL
jgi:hypothetical protein